MGVSIWSLVAYIAAIIFWNSKMKRNIGEAMVVGWIVVLLFGGGKFFGRLFLLGDRSGKPAPNPGQAVGELIARFQRRSRFRRKLIPFELLPFSVEFLTPAVELLHFRFCLFPG